MKNERKTVIVRKKTKNLYTACVLFLSGALAVHYSPLPEIIAAICLFISGFILQKAINKTIKDTKKTYKILARAEERAKKSTNKNSTYMLDLMNAIVRQNVKSPAIDSLEKIIAKRQEEEQVKKKKILRKLLDPPSIPFKHRAVRTKSEEHKRGTVPGI